MSFRGPVDLAWVCPVCSTPQTDTADFAGNTNRAREEVVCGGCQRKFTLAVSASLHMHAPAPEPDAEKDR